MSLPPTNESCQPNVPRAHLQCDIWKHADEANPPDIDPTMHVWKRDAINKTMTPTLHLIILNEAILIVLSNHINIMLLPASHVTYTVYNFTDLINNSVCLSVCLSTTNSIWQLIKCDCESSARCSCSCAVLPCTILCGCADGLDCSNEHTTQQWNTYPMMKTTI